MFFIMMIILLLSGLTWKKIRKYKKLPPGPLGLPFFGSWFHLDGERPYVTFQEWGKKYGGIVSFKIFGRNKVVVTDYEAIHEVLVLKQKDFAGRQTTFKMDVLNTFDKDNFVFGDFSNRYVRLKKAVSTGLKMYGDGLLKLEHISNEVIQGTLDEIKVHEGKSFDIIDILKRATINIITTMIAAHKLSEKDMASFLSTERVAKMYLNPTGKGWYLNLFPWIAKFPNKDYDNLKGIQQSYEKVFRNVIRNVETLVSENSDDEPNCLLEYLLTVDLKDADNNPLITTSNIYVITQDLMLAGMSTTAQSMYGILAIAIQQPEIQKRMQQEIEETIGRELPCLADRRRMPYIEAVIMEILRYESSLPLAVAHKATTDTTLRGYSIDKNTEVLVNLWAMHHDEEFWNDPQEFRPERFLDDNGQLLPPDHPRRKRLMPFGAGRRVCIGEVLAKNRLFLFVVCFFQTFTFHKDLNGIKPPKLDYRDTKFMLLKVLSNYELYAVQR